MGIGAIPVRSEQYYIQPQRYWLGDDIVLALDLRGFPIILQIADITKLLEDLNCQLNLELTKGHVEISMLEWIDALRRKKFRTCKLRYGKPGIVYDISPEDFYVCDGNKKMEAQYYYFRRDVCDDDNFSTDVRSILSYKFPGFSSGDDIDLHFVSDDRPESKYLYNGGTVFAKFISETCRNMNNWIINLMILDLMENKLLEVEVEYLNEFGNRELQYTKLHWKSFFDIHPMKGSSDRIDRKREVNLLEAKIVMYWLHFFWPYQKKPEVIYGPESCSQIIQAKPFPLYCDEYFQKLKKNVLSEVLKLLYKRMHSVELWIPTRDEDFFMATMLLDIQNDCILCNCLELRLNRGKQWEDDENYIRVDLNGDIRPLKSR